MQIKSIRNSPVLLFLLILAGCATKQAVMPVKTPQAVILKNAAPVPTAVIPPAYPKIEPQPVKQPASGENLNENFVIEHGQAVEVITNPPGAKIEMNNKFLGIAPGKFYVIRKPNRYGFFPRMTISAVPQEGAKGQYLETKIFDGYTPTPEKIYFDMSLPPTISEIEGQ